MKFTDTKSKWKSKTILGLLIAALTGMIHTTMMVIGGHHVSASYHFVMYAFLGLSLGGLIFSAYGRFKAETKLR